MPGFDRPLEIVVRQTSLATAPDVSGTVSLKKKNSIRVVELVMEPALAIALVSDRLKMLPTPWQQPLKSLASPKAYQLNKDDVFIVPAGVWHRSCAEQPVTLLSVLASTHGPVSYAKNPKVDKQLISEEEILLSGQTMTVRH